MRQTREFFEVGSAKPIRTNIRTVTATNKALAMGVKKGRRFKELNYRVAVVMIRVPALWERRTDIPLPVEHFVRKSAARHRRPPSPSVRQPWVVWWRCPGPSTSAQLEDFIEQPVLMTDRDILTGRDIFAEGDGPAAADLSSPTRRPA